MVFIEGSGHYINTNNTHLSDVAAIEGRIFVTALRLANISFISDTMYSTESGYYNWPDANEGISKRNTTVVNNYIAGRIRILHNTTQGVAVMVRPNAPRDVDTGLLKPTIAVATVGGLSVIHDDDSVTDKIASVGSNYTRLWKLTWLDKTRLATYFDRGYNKINCLTVWDLSTTLSADYSSFDFNGGNDSFAAVPGGLYPGLGDVGNNKLANATSGNFVSIASNDPYIAAGKTTGVSIWNKTKPRSTGGIAYAHITAKYNTGWMMQDMRINTCASTTPGLLQDKNNVANSDFSSNITGWGGVGGTAALVSGRLRITATIGFHGTNVTIPGLSIGQRYTYSADVETNGASPSLRIQISGIGLLTNSGVTSSQNTVVKIYDSFIATATSHIIEIIDYSGDAGNVMYVDNVEFKMAVEDVSGQQRDLEVRGDIVKTPVGTGNDLVSFGNFGNSNSLLQRYGIGDLQFGANNLGVMVWVKFNDVADTGFIFDRATASSGGSRFAMYTEGSGLKVYTWDGSASSETNYNISLLDGDWCMITWIREGTSHKTYINDELVDTDVMTSRNISNTTAQLVIGDRYNNPGNGQFFAGEIALLRIFGIPSGEVPPDDHIKQMYNDEKAMFKPNAKCTMVGTASYAKALAYDNSNGHLHVGSDSGRSVFDGLVRVDETTDPVTSTISAVNGMIAED